MRKYLIEMLPINNICSDFEIIACDENDLFRKLFILQVLNYNSVEEFEEFENLPYSVLDPLKCKETFLVNSKVVSILNKTDNKFVLSYF